MALLETMKVVYFSRDKDNRVRISDLPKKYKANYMRDCNRQCLSHHSIMLECRRKEQKPITPFDNFEMQTPGAEAYKNIAGQEQYYLANITLLRQLRSCTTP